MKTMKLQTIIIITLLTASTLSLHAQQQTDIPKITDITILKQLLNEQGINNKEVQVEVVTFQPGSSSSAHRHPCPTFGYILEGELESVFEGVKHIYKQGDSFYEKPFGLHSVTRNNSTTKPARLLVFFINDPSKPNSIHLK
jgi:quercetin dioxygenase-like cupin family protein